MASVVAQERLVEVEAGEPVLGERRPVGEQ